MIGGCSSDPSKDASSTRLWDACTGFPRRLDPTGRKSPPALVLGMTDHGRNEPRYRCRLRVDYATRDGSERAGFTTDIGPRGLFVLASPPPPSGQRILLEVAFPDGQREKLNGRITWSRPGKPRPGPHRGGFGVELESPTEGWYALLSQLAQA